MELAHYTIATVGRRPFAEHEADRRRILRALAELCGDRLLVFSLVDEHLHNGLRGERLGSSGGRSGTSSRDSGPTSSSSPGT